MTWNFKIAKAPSGRIVEKSVIAKSGKTTIQKTFVPDLLIVATKCGLVTRSRILENGRWENLAMGEKPVAWQGWPVHPHSESAHTEETK